MLRTRWVQWRYLFLLLIDGPSAASIAPRMLIHTMVAILLVQALGPVALVSLLLNDGLSKAIPGSDVNENPNLPENPELQAQYNRAAVQVYSSSIMLAAVVHVVIKCSGLRD